MSTAGGRLAKFWYDNKVLIVMGGLLTGGHLGWRWMQEQEEFVPKGQAKEYPWIEIARHVARHVKEAIAAADADIAAAAEK